MMTCEDIEHYRRSLSKDDRDSFDKQLQSIIGQSLESYCQDNDVEIMTYVDIEDRCKDIISNYIDSGQFHQYLQYYADYEYLEKEIMWPYTIESDSFDGASDDEYYLIEDGYVNRLYINDTDAIADYIDSRINDGNVNERSLFYSIDLHEFTHDYIDNEYHRICIDDDELYIKC